MNVFARSHSNEMNSKPYELFPNRKRVGMGWEPPLPFQSNRQVDHIDRGINGSVLREKSDPYSLIFEAEKGGLSP
jgi:hypothetical protein